MADGQSQWPMKKLIILPGAAVCGLLLHMAVSQNRPVAEVQAYSYFLIIFLITGLAIAAMQIAFKNLRAVAHLCPILAAAIVFLAVWGLFTTWVALSPP